MIRPIVYSVAASLALNMLALVTFDRAFLLENRKMEILKKQKILQAERDNLPFEFIESPRVAASQKPKQARKMSDRDSVSRGEPLKMGPSDQLAQLRAKPSQNPSSASKAQQEMKKAEAQPPVKPSKEEVVRVPSPAPRQAQTQSPVDQNKQAARQAVAGKKELSGLDRITTQAMARNRSKGVGLYGATSFDAMGSDMGVYMKNVKERIWLAWFPYLSFQYPNDFQAADVVVDMTIGAKGEVKMVKVLDSYGSPVFSDFCMNAVQRASGFGPVPKEILAMLGKDELEIKFAFHYR